MALTHDEELRDRVEELLGDVGSLHTIAALGYAEADAARVARCLEQLAAHHPLVDLRRADDVAAVAKALTAPVLVAVVSAQEVPRSVQALIGAITDGQGSVPLDSATNAPRLTKQSVVVLCEGARHGEPVHKALRRISYWAFVP